MVCINLGRLKGHGRKIFEQLLSVIACLLFRNDANALVRTGLLIGCKLLPFTEPECFHA